MCPITPIPITLPLMLMCPIAHVPITVFAVLPMCLIAYVPFCPCAHYHTPNADLEGGHATLPICPITPVPMSNGAHK